MRGSDSGFVHPYDTPFAGGLRFVVECIAWVTLPWAIGEHSIPLAAVALAVLVALSALFTTPGDKRQVFVPTPGPTRVVIDLILHAAAAAGALLIWPSWYGAGAALIPLASLIAGMPRIRWLLQGAAPRDGR